MLSRNHRAVALLGAFVLLPATLAAQGGTTVTGRVTNAATGTPLPNASVVLQGTRLGGLTNEDGRYSFTVPAPQANGQVGTLQARLIGYAPSTAQVRLTGASVSQDFALTASAIQLEGVVVTALGMTKEKSQLGTAQQQVTSDQLTQTRVQNVVNALQGKVSGVQITGAGTQGGSSRIVIRGANSITGNNQPLFIVDGVPISNREPSGARGIGGDPDGGYDYGSAISDLNPDDIESVSILKGPNAAAIYGSRGSNGVVLITTKKGRAGSMRTEISTSYSWEKPSILPDFQNQYGQGASGQFSFLDGQGSGVNDWADQSWGPQLDGRSTGCTFIPKTDPRYDPNNKYVYDNTAPCAQFNALGGAPWVAHPDNVKDFFNTGHTLAATVAVSGGTERANARLSLGTEDVDGIVPNNFFKKTTALLSGQLRVNDRLTTDANISYNRNTGRNRPGTGYNVGILEQFIWFGRQVDMDALRKYSLGGATNGGPGNREFNWNYNYHNNPFWLQYENPRSDARDRFTGGVSARYEFLPWLSLTGRTGSDIYRFDANQNWAEGNIISSSFVDPSYAGGFSLFNEYSNENTSELMVNADRDLTSRIRFSGMVAGATRNERYSNTQQSTNGISAPGIYNVSNAAITPSLSQYDSRRRVNSVYGSASFTLDGWWTVEGTARNDWSSTLPEGKNSYFYPSLNTSVVLTDAIPSMKTGILSYAKIRGSVAQVGNDAAPYKLRTTFVGNSNKFAGLPQFSLADVLENADLKPEITRSTEVGLEIGLFNDRATLDASYYQKSTKDQIFNVAVSPTSGYASKAINAGRMDNKGFEALLTVTPVAMQNGFNWTTTFNFSRNRSEVVDLYPGIETINLGDSWYTRIEARKGKPYGAIYGYAFARDSATGQLLTSGGITMATNSPEYLGNIEPDWVGGWANTFTYKNVSLSALLDVKHGGKIVSVTNFFGDYAGVTKASLQGREVDWNNPGVVVKGIDVDTGEPNDITVTAEQYWQNIFPVMEPYVYDASYVKLREIRVGVDLPQQWARRLLSSSASIAFTARNLWTSTDVPNIDPEFAYTTGNFQGIEFAALPNPRTFGLSLRLTP